MASIPRPFRWKTSTECSHPSAVPAKPPRIKSSSPDYAGLPKTHSSLTWGQLKVLRAIERCRTAALGGHRDRCLDCLHRSAISFHSCRNRHCPKCQTNAREKWLRARQNELLPVNYLHVVFSVPHELVPLIWQNKRAETSVAAAPGPYFKPPYRK